MKEVFVLFGVPLRLGKIAISPYKFYLIRKVVSVHKHSSVQRDEGGGRREEREEGGERGGRRGRSTPVYSMMREEGGGRRERREEREKHSSVQHDEGGGRREEREEGGEGEALQCTA